MAIIKATYVEPSDYFNADMKKAIKEWEKEEARKKKLEKKTKKGKKK